MFDFFDPANPGVVLSRRRIILLSISLSTLLLGAVIAKPVYHLFKGFRAQSLAGQAEVLRQHKELSDAAEKAQAALTLRPTDPSAIRVLAKIETEAGQPVALQVWQALFATGSATSEDRRSYIELAIRLGLIDTAYSELQKLVVQEPNTGPNLWLLSQVCLATRDVAGSVDFARAAQQLDPTNQQYQLFASSLLYDSSDEATRKDSRETVWKVAGRDSAMSLEALRFLAKRPDLSPTEMRRVIELLKACSCAGTREKLLSLELNLRLEPGQSKEIMDRAIKEYQGATFDDLTQFAAWLNGRQEFDSTLRALPEARALERKDSLIVYLDALAGLERWVEVEHVLKSKDNPLPEVMTAAFQARSAIKLNNPGLAEIHWKRALQAGEQSADELRFLGEYAEKCGEYQQAEKVYRTAIGNSRNPRAAYQSLLKLAERRNDTAKLRELISEMLKRWPQDRSLRNDYAYLSLLLGTDLDDAKAIAAELVNEFPTSLPHRTTLALARYRQNDFPSALQAYAGHGYDWRLALPGNRAIYAAVLQANGRMAEARSILNDLPRSDLRKEELALLHDG